MDQMTVKEIHGKHAAAFKTVTESTSLDTVVWTFAAGASVQAVFVIDDTGSYRGAITRNDLLKWVTAKIVGSEATSSLGAGNMREILTAGDAGYLMRGDSTVPPVSETMDLAAALTLMMNSGEPVLPVVDSEGKLVGDLRISEILHSVLSLNGEELMSVQAGGVSS